MPRIVSPATGSVKSFLCPAMCSGHRIAPRCSRRLISVKEYLAQVANLADEIAHYSRAKSASKPASVLARSGCTVPCDHLAGMTDRSVMREYQRLIGTDV